MMVKFVCTECAKVWRLNTDLAREQLKQNGQYGHGDHVTDERAFAMRLLVCNTGWRYVGGKIGRSTIDMVCGPCNPPTHDANGDLADPGEVNVDTGVS